MESHPNSSTDCSSPHSLLGSVWPLLGRSTAMQVVWSALCKQGRQFLPTSSFPPELSCMSPGFGYLPVTTIEDNEFSCAIWPEGIREQAHMVYCMCNPSKSQGRYPPHPRVPTCHPVPGCAMDQTTPIPEEASSPAWTAEASCS